MHPLAKYHLSVKSARVHLGLDISATTSPHLPAMAYHDDCSCKNAVHNVLCVDFFGICFACNEVGVRDEGADVKVSWLN